MTRRNVSIESASQLFSTARVAHLRVPSSEEVNEEIAKTERWLRKNSQLDGTKRLTLSTNHVPIPIPDHAVEEDVMAFKAVVRPEAAVGSVVTKWLRRMNRVPAVIDSLPDVSKTNKEGLMVHNQGLNIHLDVRDADRLIRKFGRNGCKTRIISIQLMEAKASGPGMEKKVIRSLRVKPQSVAVNAANQQIEHIGFIFCPKDRTVKVDVPLRLVNVDSSVGLKKGGWHMMVNRTVRLMCRGDSIPPFIELDVKNLALDQRIVVSDLIGKLPSGSELIPQDLTACLVKCTNEQGDEIRRWGKLER